MTNTTKCSLFMIRRNTRNGMIPLVLLMPFMAIAAFEIAKKYFGKILLPYSPLFAAILPLIVPTALLFLSSMMMLSEKEDNVASFLIISLGGKRPYLISRTGTPSLLALLINFIVLWKYATAGKNFLLSFSATATGLAFSLSTITLSSNRMEGMAMTKLFGLVAISTLVPFFAESKVWWTVSLLPPFWMGLGMKNGNSLFLAIGFLISLLWLWVAYLFYRRKS